MPAFIPGIELYRLFYHEAVRPAITDEEVRAIAARRPIGSVDQFSDSTDLLSDASWRETPKQFFRAG